ncbi:hypothetical protein [Kitasatospora sp. NPDC090091]|uniref:hypothetical protein n=1 Tax=Kitasatospora sp. NPDC090091 TaxID=3364081 RepID=UPI003804AAA3
MSGPNLPSDNPRPSILLAAFGALLVLAALAGFFLEINGAMAGTMLTLGVILLLFAVLAPRMVGDQIVFGVFRFRLSPRGGEGVRNGEREIAEGAVVRMDEIRDAVEERELSESEDPK